MLLAVFFTVTPGFLLYSDDSSIYFYYTDESSAGTGNLVAATTSLLDLNGITGNCVFVVLLFVVTVIV